MESLLREQRPTWWTYAGVAVGGVLVAGACTALVVGLLTNISGSQRRIVEVSLLRPPPPPPVEKPPEPELEREDVKLPEPEVKPEPVPQQNEPPATSDRLGLDAQPGAGSDAFGLEARKDGRDITLGEGDGTGRATAAWYVGVLQDQLNAELNKNELLRKSGYRAELRIWFTAAGNVERVELVRGTGDVKMDGVLQAALEAMAPLHRPPPADMPQPIRLRITSRGAS